MERFAAAAPNISGALENANKYLGPIGFLLNIQSFASNQDVHAGIFNYDTLNSGIGVLLSGAGIVCSFFPPASIVLATVGLIYFGAKFTVEMIASHFEKRMEAYKASYDFLMATDPNFPVDAQKFREKDGLESEREILNKYYLLNREKLTSVLLADSDALENRFAPNDVNFRRILDRCKAIWSAKADILGSRRNWQNSSEYYFSSLLDYILPRETRKNHAEQISLFELFVPGYGRDRDERRARTSELEVALDDFHPLVANPDFALIVLFDNYVEYGRHEADANKIEFLRSRIKKNPFLFPYMLEIPQMQYNDEIFEQAIAVDSVNAGWLEVSNLTEILEKMEDKISFNMLEEDGIVRALATLFYEAKKMSCCTRYLSNVADLLAEDEESKIDVRQGTHVEIDSSTDLNSARQIMNYLDEFTDEDLVAALDGESEIEAKNLFELSAFQDAVKNLIANAAMVNANFFASMQKAETVASQNELVFARLSQLLSQAKKSLDLADKFVKDSRIKEFYAKGKYLGEKEGGILGFVSGHVPLRERYEEELARFEHVVENIGKKFFRFRQYIVPREKAEAILDNLRVQLQDNGADLPDGFSMGGGSIIINDRVEKVVEYQQQLKKLIEKTESIDNLESPIELNGELAENIYLSSDFELCEYSVKAMFPSLESEN
jgi:dihydroxyacetone kinase DhaKLM complex PTS-EIIA-like component DhaM